MNNWLVISQIALWLIVIFQIIIMISFMKTIGEFLARFRLKNNKVEELSLNIGQNAPLFREKDHLNRIIRLADHPSEYSLLVFAKKGCAICHQIFQKLTLYENNVNVRVIVNYIGEELSGDLSKNKNTSYINSVDLIETYYIKKIPSIILINNDNKIVGIYDINTFDSLKGDLKNIHLKGIN